MKSKLTYVPKRFSCLLARCFPSFFARHLRNPVFVIGFAKSGKSLLARLLGLHLDVAYWQEANDIWDPQGYPWPTSARETPPQWVDPVAFTARWWRDNQHRQEEIQATFGAYQWLWRRPYFLNDTPLNTFRIPYLLAMFPEARFINVVRDGREAVYWRACKQYERIRAYPASYQAMGLAYSFEELLVRLATFWKATLEEVGWQDEALQLSQRGILLELTYEELCADTCAVLERICPSIGLDPSRFAPAIRKQNLGIRNPKWKEELDPALATQLVAVMEPMLARKGYV